MTSLPFLQDEGYLPADTSTGYLRQMPLALQQTISTAMLEHFSSDAARVVKATVRSKEDLLYLLETVGVSFGFSTSEYSASVKKAMDIYMLLFTPPLVTQLRLFEDTNIKEECLVHAFRQLTLALEVRHDFPAGTIPHVQLIARLMDHFSKIMAAQECGLSAPTWSEIVRLMLGMLDYVCSPQEGRLPSEIRLTVASVALEALVRSKTRDPEVWDLFAARLPNTYAAIAQWSVVVVAVTRAVAALSTRRALPPCIPLAWRGVIRPTRNVTNWIDYTQDDIIFVWKKICVLINPLRLKHVDALTAASEAIRDSAMVLGCASYWPRSMQPEGCDDPNAELEVCSRRIPLGISTNAILQVWGDALLHLAIGSSTKLMQHTIAELDDSRARAVEGMCFTMLRRETELRCPLTYWHCFVKMMEDVCDGTSDRLRGYLLLHATSLFLMDLPWPYNIVRKLSIFACEVLGELSDSAAAVASMLDEDDEDGASAKPIEPTPSSEHEDPDHADGTSRHAAAVREAVDMQRAAIVVVTNAAVNAHLHRDYPAVEGAVTALQAAAERFQSVPDVLQRSLCALTHIFAHIMSRPVKEASSSSGETVEWAPYNAAIMSAVVDEVVHESLAMLSAPCGTFASQSLVVALRFVAWNAYLLPDTTIVAALRSITVFCVEACRVLDHATTPTDVETLSSLYCVAVEVLGALLECPRTSFPIKNSKDHLQSVAKVIDAGFAPAKNPTLPRFQVREAAYRLLRTLEVAWWWPACDNCSATSSGVSELHLRGLCSSIQVFALGCSRVVTVAQVDQDAVRCAGDAAAWAADTDVVMLVRSRAGRRAWMVKKAIDLRERPDVDQLSSPKAMPASHEGFPSAPSFELDGSGPQTCNDLLKEVDAQPRTKAMLEAWLGNTDIQQLLETSAAGHSAPLILDSNHPVVSADIGVVDGVQQSVVTARHFMHDLGFPFGRFKPLRLDAKTLGVLKGLDLMEERRVTNVEVVFVHDDGDDGAQPLPSGGAALDSVEAYNAFCGALGWRLSDEAGETDGKSHGRCTNAEGTPSMVGARYFAGMNDVLKMECRPASVSELDRSPTDDTKKAASSNPKSCRARVLWDSTSTRFDWTAVALSAHRVLYADVCPSLRRSTHASSCLDIVVRPLVQPGLYTIVLVWPDCIAEEDVSPAMWGGPLLHNTVATAEVLPQLLREALISGVDRLYTAASHAAPHPRSVALQAFLHDLAPCSPAQALYHSLLPQ